MFRKLILKNVKKDDILIELPKSNPVKVINILDEKHVTVETLFLKNYWKEHYNFELPYVFKIAVCQFATTPDKNYNYPLLKMCVKKLIFKQKHLKLAWKVVRRTYELSKGRE